jgi:RNA polymerase sigma factor (sigma-70 family)
MNNLNDLVVKYKKLKDKKILEEIFKLLEDTIKEKARYVFYERVFNINNHPFKLVDIKQVEFKDVIQELNLETLRIINDYDITQSFETYFYASIWDWKPDFINADFFNNLNTQSIYQETIEGEEEDITEKISSSEEIKIEFKCKLTDLEQEVWELKKGNLNLSQEEIAEELGVSQKTVSNVIASIKKKIQKHRYRFNKKISF